MGQNYILDMSRYREFTLDNGLEVVIYDSGEPLFSGKLVVNNGAIDENPGEEGVAHFLEHVIVREARIRGKEKGMPIGTVSNGGTSHHRIEYGVQGFSDQISVFLEAFGTTFTDPEFDRKICEEEGKVILRETAERLYSGKSVDSQIFQIIEGRNEPILLSGTEKEISRITPAALKAYFSRTHISNNMELYLVGNLPEDIEEQITRCFGGLTPGTPIKTKERVIEYLNIPYYSHIASPGLINPTNREESNANLMIAFPIQPENSFDITVIQLMTHLFDIAESESPVYRQIREQWGLTYSGSCNYSAADSIKEDAGLFRIDINPHARYWQKCVKEVFSLIRDLQDLEESQMNEGYLSIFKRNCLASLISSVNSDKDPLNDGMLRLTQLYKKRGFSLSDEAEKIKAITPKDIKRVAQKYFPRDQNKDPNLIIAYDPHKTEIVIARR
ncbi:insulinase family protein [Candidatus Woesearchaeota archaeon]|nr:insulinase family protein [Candidatus Woesearchaeota archaeon]MBT5272187.1 insulinase family protein [Candidatus Woesearchaeota archaeon]MBT6040514.1 insulinase family protein [Candidatus Woesearchaeota archaeon]MBT6336893.1 insulinase family protein [Candidatus Woesearchaeota archaeon]MBT7927763.1 insulinase family protein [Candidatus Woesearchaeota archaeon]